MCQLLLEVASYNNYTSDHENGLCQLLFNCVIVEFLPRLFLKEDQDSYEELFLLDPGWLMMAMQCAEFATGHNVHVDATDPKLTLSQKEKVEMGMGFADFGVFSMYWKEFVSQFGITIQQLCLIFQAYGLIYPVQYDGVEGYIIPCKLPEKIIDKQICNGVTFYIDFNEYFPDEIYYKLICLALKNRKFQRLVHCSKKVCFFADLNGTDWLFEMEENPQRIKVMFQ